MLRPQGWRVHYIWIETSYDRAWSLVLGAQFKSGVSDMYIKIELTACIGLAYDKVSVQEWSKCNSASLWRKRTLTTGISARLRKMLNSIME